MLKDFASLKVLLGSANLDAIGAIEKQLLGCLKQAALNFSCVSKCGRAASLSHLNNGIFETDDRNYTLSKL